MSSWLDADAPERFAAFSPSHLGALAAFALLVALLFAGRRWMRTERRSRIVRYTLAAVLTICELTLNVWYVAEGVYDPKDTLPFELCSISLYLCVFMLLFRSARLFRIVYFIGIGGAAQALLTPVLGYDFPHFRFIEFFAAHAAIILSILYMVWVERLQPAWRNVWITFGLLNSALVLIFLINGATGGNYMFVSRKPETASLLDFLGPYPWYLLSMEAVALAMFSLLYAPFALRSRLAAKKRSGAG
ncbi:TIGR02206 family membrane protein [Paenibacillus hodogayensis]|uniref:TIGR02206 family membrane protein n=1 Tax=Paenibacillus hodogayensis TaxID=279208 RepID=A0ABV5VX03_9BACL